MPPEAMQIETVGAVRIVHLGTQFDQPDEENLSQLGNSLTRVLEEVEPALVVLDLSAVHQCNPQVLGLLKQYQQKFRERRGCIVVAGAARSIREILHITHFDRVLPLEETISTATARIAEIARAPSPTPQPPARESPY